MRSKLSSLLFGSAIFLTAVIASALHIVAWTEDRATHEVCHLIRLNYFKSGESAVKSFLDRCESETTSMSFRRATAIKNINRRLSAIRSSHLNVFSPSENKWLWQHEGSDTGIRSRMIEGELVIIGILANSPAAKAGLKRGDAIITINGEAVGSAQEAQGTAGHFKVQRAGEFLEADLDLADLIDDMSPTLRAVSDGVAILTIPSFLPQYFENDSWLKIAKEIVRFKGVVIDLRDNPGGSFPAMLRALSPFRCENPRVGKLWRTPRVGFTSEVEIKNELSAESQLEQLARANALVLKTFDGYGCYRGKVVALVDDGTSSVSEIFAESLLKKQNSAVWGTPTAGQVVMARWFSIGSLGGGDFALSIPIAGYRAEDGAEIESEGVIPERELQYDLSRALKGDDSWIEQAIEFVSK